MPGFAAEIEGCPCGKELARFRGEVADRQRYSSGTRRALPWLKSRQNFLQFYPARVPVTGTSMTATPAHPPTSTLLVPSVVCPVVSPIARCLHQPWQRPTALARSPEPTTAPGPTGIAVPAPAERKDGCDECEATYRPHSGFRFGNLLLMSRNEPTWPDRAGIWPPCAG